MGGGEGGIRTLDRGLAYTPLAGERLQPLGHLTSYRLSSYCLSCIGRGAPRSRVASGFRPRPCGIDLWSPKLLSQLVSRSATSPYY